MSKFPQKDVNELLVKCKRRCCICYRFCGYKIETDHIIQGSEDGPNDIENAIPVCFECHAEIHSYNDQHPRGRKYHAAELRLHKDQWIKLCEDHPEILVDAPRKGDVGPLQALVDELEFNLAVSDESVGIGHQTCRFLDDQFRRAISEGGIAILKEDLRNAVLRAYVACGKANQLFAALAHQQSGQPGYMERANSAISALSDAADRIKAALGLLLRFLSSET